MTAASKPELPKEQDVPDESDAPLAEGKKAKAPNLSDKTPVTKPIPVIDANDAPATEVADVAEEVNESLKAMDPDLGESTIETIDEEAPKESKTIPVTEPEETAEEVPVEIKPESTDEPTETVSEAAETAAAESQEDGLPDDPLTQQAVDDIIAEESDAVIAAEDMALELENAEEPAKQPKTSSSWLHKLLSTAKGRWLLFGSLTIALLAIAVMPQSRYFVLNSAGIRSSVSLRVIDKGTRQPLKNVVVRIGSSSAQTDSEGNAKLENIRLGRTTLHIEKRAFAVISQPLTVGWGSNPLGEFEASAVGVQYVFILKDFVSGKPISGAEAHSGDGDAISDEQGKLVLTLDTAELDDAAEVSVDITAPSYRQETVTFIVNNKEEQSIDMVPAHRHVFVSKRSGKYDVYSTDVDGKNEQKIVDGTGLERDDITLVPHQSMDIAALVSTRERVTNTNGYLLSTLYVVNTRDGNLVKIDQSEQLQIIGWSESGRLIYVKIAAGMSASDAKRHRLMSFNNADYADVKELASSNSFNDVIMAGGRIYYAPSNIFEDNPNPGLFAVDPDGNNPQTILDKEVFNIFRSSYETLDISIGASWFSYTIGSPEKAVASKAPATQYSKVFVDNPKRNTSAWVDTRDGKGVLIHYDKTAKTDTNIVSRSGLKVPVYWLNETHIIFRLNDGKETADYIASIDGGDPRKIADVTDTNGVDRWFYY